jgi:hypothetical protein
VAAQCCKGARVKVTRSNLSHVLKHDEQRETLKGYGNSRNYYGRILSGSGKQGYNICFDDLPAGFQDVTIKRRILITVVEDGEEEKEHDHVKAPPFLGHPFPGSVFGIFLQNRTKIHGM